jgi:7,8-dihydropterin-6-yl-methyl-4-(beta-D-ribofuranosyl)aminobenzene 5'-phosphate synthase
MKRILFPFIMLFMVGDIIIAQDKHPTLSKSEVEALTNALSMDSAFSTMVTSAGDPVKLYENFKSNLRTADSLWNYDQEHLSSLRDIGSTKRFELLPLIDWFTSNDSLIGESGVSYLIRTDDATILFDVGLNLHDVDPSPLLRNMKRLGIRLEEIDVIVISHPHGDHIGGKKWEGKGTLSLTSRQIDLGRKRVYTPIPMTYPGLKPVFSQQPTRIAKGVATIGVIACPLFFGSTVEQAVAINVEKRGIVVVSGCGHQTIEKLVRRTERLFDQPIYGLLGGFHLPLTEGRNIRPYLKYFYTGRLPWQPLTRAEVTNIADMLKLKGVQIIGISGHDSCDSTIAIFRNAFGKSYTDIIVGKSVSLQ